MKNKINLKEFLKELNNQIETNQHPLKQHILNLEIIETPSEERILLTAQSTRKISGNKFGVNSYFEKEITILDLCNFIFELGYISSKEPVVKVKNSNIVSDKNIISYPYSEYKVVDRLVGEFSNSTLISDTKAQVGDIIIGEDNKEFYVNTIRHIPNTKDPILIIHGYYLD